MRRMTMNLRFLGKVLQGALIGLGAVLPGISGGVLSVVFGVYRPIMELLSDPVHKWRTHLPELFPYMIGSAAGFLGVANLLSYVLETYPEQSVCVFVGLIGGMLPSLWREAGEQGRTGENRIVSGVTFAAMIFLLFSLQTSKTAVEPGLGAYLFCGFALALSVIAPGMSFSTLLMPLGLYTSFVEGIGHLRPEVLIPGMTGCVVTFVCLARLVNRLLEKQYAGMSHGIFGIISAATVMTVPWNSFATSPETASRNLFCMAAGIVAALLLEVMNEKMACFPENETE